ncbi:AN1-type domain-containing protein [Plasmodiophora brassicae]
MEFVNVGAHCSHASCRQQDYVPFRCDGCHQWFCLQHRTYEAHRCRTPARQSRIVIQCPICAESFHVYDGQQADAIVNEHLRIRECDRHRASVASTARRQACSVSACKAQAMTFDCAACGKRVCVRHRFPDDHQCARPNSIVAQATQTCRVM